MMQSTPRNTGDRRRQSESGCAAASPPGRRRRGGHACFLYPTSQLPDTGRKGARQAICAHKAQLREPPLSGQGPLRRQATAEGQAEDRGAGWERARGTRLRRVSRATVLRTVCSPGVAITADVAALISRISPLANKASQARPALLAPTGLSPVPAPSPLRGPPPAPPQWPDTVRCPRPLRRDSLSWALRTPIAFLVPRQGSPGAGTWDRGRTRGKALAVAPRQGPSPRHPCFLLHSSPAPLIFSGTPKPRLHAVFQGLGLTRASHPRRSPGRVPLPTPTLPLPDVPNVGRRGHRAAKRPHFRQNRPAAAAKPRPGQLQPPGRHLVSASRRPRSPRKTPARRRRAASAAHQEHHQP